jgi:hypothetical protein
MNRFVVMAVAVVMLAAGGAARAATAAEKEKDHWLALAATVKAGMTRAEVEKILPMCTSTKAHPLVGTSAGWRYVYLSYPVSGVWNVEANYCCPTNRWPINYMGTSKPSQAELSQDRLSEPVMIEKIVKQWPVVIMGTNVVMNEALAIEIGTRYVREYEPNLDISLEQPTASFFTYENHGISLQTPTAHLLDYVDDRRRGEKGSWSVRFGVPSHCPYGRRVYSHCITIDEFGRVWAPPMTVSP